MMKSELRARLRAELRALDPARRAAESAAICREVRAHPAWSAARLVCAFLPLPGEPAIAPLWEGEGAPAFCFPRVRGEGVELVRLDDPETLRRLDWKLEAAGIADAPVVSVREVDVFLVPGLGFTRDGQRLGRGGGWYDRLLPQRAPASVALGVCFRCQIVQELPHEPHDQRVDAVVTDVRPG